MSAVDACAHPLLTSAATLREYLPAPWSLRAIPALEHQEFASKRLGLVDEAQSAMGSDPAVAIAELLERRGISDVILLPPTRNLHPNQDLASAICAATNNWLADVWLSASDHFWGSIRINPSDSEAALRELERWADHPQFVQVAVPTQSRSPYGQRIYFPLWEAAARLGLPVALHSDGGAGTDFPPTMVGHLRNAIEFATLQPLNAVFHLASFIAEGVLQRLPDLRIVCAEGGLDVMTPLFWRLDKDYRGVREEIPWVKRMPSHYVYDQVRFCAHRVDEPADGVPLQRWMELTHARDILMYASNFPAWDTACPELESVEPDVRERILAGNARELYGLPGAA